MYLRYTLAAIISVGLMSSFASIFPQSSGFRQASAQETPRTSATAPSHLQFSANHKRFLERYCTTCHNEALNTANLRLDNADFTDIRTDAGIWEKVIHKLRTGDMPPVDSPQPAAGARNSLLSWLVTSLDEVAALDPNPGRPAVYRLNRTEYTNAIRDLLAVEIDGDVMLPTDGSDFGFDNIADSLTVSPMLMDRYMLAASKISRLAIGDPDIRPSVQTYEVTSEVSQEDRMGEEFPFGSRGGTSVRHHFPLDGDYLLKLRSGIGDGIEVRVDGERIAYFEPDKGKGGGKGGGKGKGRGMEVRFSAKTGTRLITVSFVKTSVALEGIAPRSLPSGRQAYGFSNYYARLRSFEISGPYNATGIGKDSPSREKIFVCEPTSDDDEAYCAEEILSTLARRAYRRPVTRDDVQTLLKFYEDGRRTGGFDAGIQLALKRIIVDPEFLFRVEADPEGVDPGTAYALSDLELASRLSFFLWSSIPDDELLAVAERGELKDPAVLQHQVRRMLADTRSETLVTNFASQWLYLRNMRAVAPNTTQFPEWGVNLGESMRRETELFLLSQLREDRPVDELLSADYTYLNERLAKHYGIPNVYGSSFRRVELDDSTHRSGLLGQGSILTLTSYSTRTSPVKRGKWLMENILGSPPPPPPPNVPALPQSDDIKVAATMRERMELHRADPVCAGCHVKMDPLGFSLEEFDGIGKWRSVDEDGLPVDSTAILPDGTTFQGPRGLREFLMGQSDEFVRTTTEKMLTYALGRGVEYYDQPAIRNIMRDAGPDDYRWSSIILGIVRSTPFQMRRSSS